MSRRRRRRAGGPSPTALVEPGGGGPCARPAAVLRCLPPALAAAPAAPPPRRGPAAPSCRTARAPARARRRTAWRTPRGSAPRPLPPAPAARATSGQLVAGSASRAPRYGAPLSVPAGAAARSPSAPYLAISFCTRSSCVQTTSSSLSCHCCVGREHAGRRREVRARLLRLEGEAQRGAVPGDLREVVSHVGFLSSSSCRRTYPVVAVSTTSRRPASGRVRVHART